MNGEPATCWRTYTITEVRTESATPADCHNEAKSFKTVSLVLEDQARQQFRHEQDKVKKHHSKSFENQVEPSRIILTLPPRG
jgi:hypothetical protein